MVFISEEIILNRTTKKMCFFNYTHSKRLEETQQNSFQVAFTDFLYVSNMQGRDPRYDLFWLGLV